MKRDMIFLSRSRLRLLKVIPDIETDVKTFRFSVLISRLVSKLSGSLYIIGIVLEKSFKVLILFACISTPVPSNNIHRLLVFTTT